MDYNAKVQLLVDKFSFRNKNFILIDKGREINEKAIVLFEDGKLTGIGYVNLNYQINNMDMIRSLITNVTHTESKLHLIQSYIRKNKKIKMKMLVSG